ncbi:MAG: MFS transporter [Thermomicrobiales bacterium]
MGTSLSSEEIAELASPPEGAVLAPRALAEPPPQAGPEPHTPDETNPFASGRAGLTAGLMLTIVAVAFQALAVATILPAIVADLGGLNFYGWAFSAYLLTQLVGIVVGGLISDGRGPALPFAIGVVFFSSGLLLGGFAPSMEVLILGRALQGFGGGCIFSSAYVAVGRGFPAAAKPRMLALMSTGWVVPGLIGPAISGLMAEAFGWRAVFLVLTPMALLAALLALPSLRTVPRGAQHPQARQRVLLSVALSAGAGLMLGSASAPGLDFGGVSVPGVVVAGAMIVAGGVLAVPSLRRLLPVGTLRAAPGLPAAIATMGLINLAFFGVDAFVPLMLVEVRGASIGFAGLALTAGTIAWSSGSWIQARVSMRVSRRTMEWIGLTLISVAIVVIASVLLPQTPMLLGPLGWGVAGLGMGFAYITLNLTMLELAEPGQEGNASSSMQLASVLGSGLGAGIGGALVAVVHAQGNSVQHALTFHYGLMLLAVLVGFFTARGLPQFARPPVNPPPGAADAA